MNHITNRLSVPRLRMYTQFGPLYHINLQCMVFKHKNNFFLYEIVIKKINKIKNRVCYIMKISSLYTHLLLFRITVSKDVIRG